ncbi:Undecaprenyl-phosphate galactose phosphotransferase, WbaP/exopolysaccharide biosynthesis polyprenyl glycosylphosphotransferase [Tessaracoccus bendigoensis DSM 12906]|uniref:Undecaprenyl-phosphate galactose phosphotransferase, WbaP/exopolysaccharide biosynthesis polyprenyl glycosylphosphotransferase n=1 Tax=Tessaracoccus bendigoensis DSM 12906 TaxID=1123357 RepID=A0A1M6IHR6_9ACTN|nr:sugar transferase [Tessaracoccus bendigoensis]SHJ33982.1 Undecaprenyl-phosphate galactose phosphotransferase, WbaP/exopolysaccharide biosynthesis polyprenyl glycosylphosphotransferase [Tessaracoccus bendigoensis DSM 12906]
MTTVDLEVGAGSRGFGETFTELLQGSTTKRRLLLAMVDGAMVAFAALTAYLVRFDWPNDGDALSPIWLFAILPLTWLGLLAVFGAYALPSLHTGMEEYRRVLAASVTLAGLIGVGCYLLGISLSRMFFVVTFLLGIPLLLAARHLRRRLFNKLRARGALTSPAVVVGTPDHVDSVTRVLRREKWLGYRIVGALTSSGGQETPGGLPILGTVDDVATLARLLPLKVVIFAEGSFSDAQQFKRMAWELEQVATEMIVVPTLSDISAGRLVSRPVGGLPLVHVERPHAVAASRWYKRLFDIVGSSLLLLASAPIIAAVAVAIKLEDRGPVFFKQTRVGRWGQEFECFKIRSMVVDAEARKQALASANEGAGVLFKIAHDPRITRVGRFIRRFSIDELPQFLNVLLGEMSMVGPRPALPSEVARYDRDAVRRLDVRPGLTGLWQVSGRSDLSWEETVRLDVYYVDNWSMLQDVVIIARTARAVFGSAGAY